MTWTYPSTVDQPAPLIKDDHNDTTFITTLTVSQYPSTSNQYVLTVTFVNERPPDAGYDRTDPAGSFVWMATVGPPAGPTRKFEVCLLTFNNS